MRFWISLFIVVTLMRAGAAFAGPSEAREVARLNNCNPKKIEVFDQKMGGEASTTYRVECILPKTTNDKAGKMPNAMLVQCQSSLCEMLRPVTSVNK